MLEVPSGCICNDCREREKLRGGGQDGPISAYKQVPILFV